MDWLEARWQERRVALRPGRLQLMYGIDGRSELDGGGRSTHLEGYRGSRPVRIGNGAYGQLQLDIYGELMDAVYLYNKYAAPVGYDAWSHLRKLVDWVCDNWGREDEGIWEVRGGRRHFVYSKFMCWVALDRGLRLADKRSFPADRARWLKARDAIYEEVMAQGLGPEAAGVRPVLRLRRPGRLGPAHAAGLLHGPERPADARDRGRDPQARHTRAAWPPTAWSTATTRQAAPDGLPGAEGTFNMCSFWLVEALTRAGRTDPARLDEARLLFEQMLGYANHLGPVRRADRRRAARPWATSRRRSPTSR